MTRTIFNGKKDISSALSIGYRSMSPPSVNNRGPPSSEHIIGHGSNSKYQPCYPCNNNASSAASSASSKSMEEDDEPNTITPPQLQEHAANVGDLMAKAKKAAASLWLILHAQVSYHTLCRICILALPITTIKTFCLTFIYPPFSASFRTVANHKAHVHTVAATIQNFF